MKHIPLFRMFFQLLAGVLLCANGGGALAAVANQIQSIAVAQGQDDSQVLKLSFKDEVALSPVHFTIANPNRIVLDFPQTSNGLGRYGETIEQGVIKAYNVMQSGERTRVVVNLAAPAQYEVRQSGNYVLVAVKAEKLAEGERPAAHFAAPEPTKGLAVRDVEFKRGKDGEGRVVVTLSDPGVGLDIKEQGQGIQVDFLNTALPAALQRRLDVADFATPVQIVETFASGKNVRLKVAPSGKWDYSAYQMGNQFILELRALDPTQSTLLDKPRYTGEKLSLNFQNVDVRSVLQVIADFTGLNIITSDTVSGSLTLRLKDVPWDQALDIILRAKGLDKRSSGNVIWVAPRDELAAKEKLELEARQQISDLEDLATEFIRLNYLRANEAQAILNGQSVAAVQGSEKVSCESKAVGVGGTATQAATTAASGAGAQRILSKRGTTSYDLKTNTLFIQDTPSKIREAKELLASVDVPTKQVMIEARVVVANDTFSRTLGARLGFKTRVGSKLVDNTPIGISTTANDAAAVAGGTVGTTVPFNVDLPATSLGPTTPSIGFSIIEGAGNAILGLELQALEADQRGKIISNPRVITQNQKPAVILQGQQIPYITPATANSPATVSFKDAFLCLLVDPQVLNNDTMILNVEIQKDAAGTAINTGGGSAIPIDTQRVKTQVRVKNGETAVLGGIFEQSLKNDTNKVPFLGDLPFLGFFFRDTIKQDEKTELLIFLTPRVLDDTILFQ